MQHYPLEYTARYDVLDNPDKGKDEIMLLVPSSKHNQKPLAFNRGETNVDKQTWRNKREETNVEKQEGTDKHRHLQRIDL